MASQCNASSYLVILLAKVKISITVDRDVLKWIDMQIKKKKLVFLKNIEWFGLVHQLQLLLISLIIA